MKKEEKKALKELMKKSFPFLARFFFTISPHTFVAVQEKRLLGGIVLTLFPTTRGRGGLVSWIFTHPKAQRMGIGQSLLDEALVFFQQEGVNQIFACIEGYNSRSQNLFKSRGFSRLSFKEQIKAFGFQTPLIWYYCQHLMDIGHFLWVKDGISCQEERKGPGGWLGTLFMNSLILILALWRRGNLESPHLYLAPLSFFLFLSVRDGAMFLAGRRFQLPLQFHSWESGFCLTGGLALLLGGFFPVPGSRYPQEKKWRYQENRLALGYMGIAGSLALILTTIILGLVSRSTLLPLPVQGALSFLLFVGQWFSIMDTLPAFFPLSSFNGRRVWDINRYLWGLLVLLAVLSLFL